MRVRRASVDAPGISRRRRGTGFSYLEPSGRVVDKVTRRRIRSLAIPPAWTDVWICPDPNGHIQAVGTDAAGRRQYAYHERWRARRDAEKFRRMIAFARALPALRKQVAVDLRRTGLPREKALACAIRLLDQAMFRIGSEVYAKENGSFGLATLRKDHVRIRGNLIVFDFDAKSGRRRVQETRDSAILAAIRSMKRRRNGGPELLAFRKEGGWHDVRSGDINDYLRDAAAGEFTAKDFRTWHATVLGAVSLAAKASEAGGITSRRRLVSASVKEVAEYLGNTPAVARASYIDPRVIDSFEQGVTIAKTLEHVRIDDPTDPSFRDSVEAAVLDLLEDTHSAGARAA